MTSEGKSDLTRSLLDKTKITVSHIFKLMPDNLVDMFSESNLKPATSENLGGKGSKSLELLQRWGFAQGVLKGLATEADTGVIGDKRDLIRRIKYFGENTKPLPQLPSILESIKDALNDKILIALAVAAFFTLIAGWYSASAQGEPYGWVPGLSIYIAIFIVVALTAVNDWLKDKQFVLLQSSVKDENITVIRGKHGATQSINIYDLVVGDVILLETGARIPADCLLIEGTDIKVDEKIYSGGEQPNVVRKLAANAENLSDSPDPFLIADTLIASGSGKAVVCVVGKKSRRGAHESKLDTSTKTPLQKKLENLGSIFTKWGLYAALAILVASTVNFIIKTSTMSEYQSIEQILPNIVQLFTIPITIIIVAVPEGLPLSITLALAYSVMRMKQDGVLVRDLESPERMGRVDEIVTGKTATLTSNDMKVDSFYVQSLLIRNTRKNTLFNCELFPNVIDIVQESVLYNCEARIEMDDRAYYVPVGNGTEVGFLRFLQEAEIPIHDLIKKKLGRIEAIIPFSSLRKRSVTAVRHPDNENVVRVYVKGAPEIIVSKCSRTFDIEGKITPLSDSETNYILNDILVQKFTTVGFRTLAFAYKDFTLEEFQDLKQQYNNFEREEDRVILESQLTFVGLFALFDPLRPKVVRSVQFAAIGHMTTRLVSGDHLETAKAVAIQAGIITQAQAEDTANQVCLTGEEFRAILGDKSDRSSIKQLKQTFKNGIKVIARATPYDKYLLIKALIDQHKTVAASGEGIADVDALATSDVGFAMGSGCSVAKDASAMILTTDDFQSILMAAMWGRNIYNNVKKFIQFQVTFNITTLAIVFFGCATKGETPLNVVQLLWINLVMDTLAAIALGSERPHPSIIKNKPQMEKEQIITKVMWRQIFGVSIYIVVVMILQYFFADNMWGIEYKDVYGWVYSDATLADYIATLQSEGVDITTIVLPKVGDPTNKCIVFTLIFNTFMWLHFFNQFNCRKVGGKQFNICHNILPNWLFLLVWIGQVVVQYLFVQYAGLSLETAPLTPEQHAACIIWGSTVLVVSALLKLTPNAWLEKIGNIADDSREPVKTGLVRLFDSASAPAVSKKVEAK